MTPGPSPVRPPYVPARCSICQTFLARGRGAELCCPLCDQPNARERGVLEVQKRHLSLRCRICDECYPLMDEWLACPNCMEEPTFPSINEPTLTHEQAISRAKHAAFGEYLLQRDIAARG